MAEITGSVTVTGIIAPTDTNDTYPVTDPKYGVDGLRNVGTISDRNSIPPGRRKLGMIVGVGVSGASGQYYKLINDAGGTATSDPDWAIFTSGVISFESEGVTGATSASAVNFIGETGIGLELTESPTGTAQYKIFNSSIVGTTGDLVNLDPSKNYANRYVWVTTTKSFYVLKNGATGSSQSDWVPMLITGGNAFATPGETNPTSYYG